METKVLYINDSEIEKVAGEVANILKDGGIAVIPTDTIYGIVAIDDIEKSVDRIYEIKKRQRDKKLIRLIGSLDVLKLYTYQYPEKLIERYWPGPLTIIFKNRKQDTVALRYPEDRFLSMIFKYIDYRAIVAPSANISGGKNLLKCRDVIKEFYGKVDIIVCNDKQIRDKPSTIIDVTDEKNWRIVRQGALKISF